MHGKHSCVAGFPKRKRDGFSLFYSLFNVCDRRKKKDTVSQRERKKENIYKTVWKFLPLLSFCLSFFHSASHVWPLMKASIKSDNWIPRWSHYCLGEEKKRERENQYGNWVHSAQVLLAQSDSQTNRPTIIAIIVNSTKQYHGSRWEFFSSNQRLLTSILR